MALILMIVTPATVARPPRSEHTRFPARGVPRRKCDENERSSARPRMVDLSRSSQSCARPLREVGGIRAVRGAIDSELACGESTSNRRWSHSAADRTSATVSSSQEMAGWRAWERRATASMSACSTPSVARRDGRPRRSSSSEVVAVRSSRSHRLCQAIHPRAAGPGHGVGQEHGGDHSVRRARPAADQLGHDLVRARPGPLEHPGRQGRALEQVGPQDVVVRSVHDEREDAGDARSSRHGQHLGLGPDRPPDALDGRGQGVHAGPGDGGRTEVGREIGVEDHSARRARWGCRPGPSCGCAGPSW